MPNVPDDWDNYWRRCTRCGSRYHASEYCLCDDITDEELAAYKSAEEDYKIHLQEEWDDWEEYHAE